MAKTVGIVTGGGAASVFVRGRWVNASEKCSCSIVAIRSEKNSVVAWRTPQLHQFAYWSSELYFVKSALSSYTHWDFIALVAKTGIAYHEKTLEQLFCDKSSQQILGRLLTEWEEAGVKIQTRCQINSVEQLSDGYFLQTPLEEFRCHSLVVATGGLFCPTMGASEFDHELAEQFGLDVVDRQRLSHWLSAMNGDLFASVLLVYRLML